MAKRKSADPPLYLVMGGRVADTQTKSFVDPAGLHTVGYYPTYEAALRAWQGASQRNVDDAFVKYVIVQLW